MPVAAVQQELEVQAEYIMKKIAFPWDGSQS